MNVDGEPHKMDGSGLFDRIWSLGCPGMNPLSGDGPGGHGSPPLSLSIPQLWIGQAYQPAQATAYHLGAPNACLSSDKMDFQFSQGSQAGSGRLESRQTFSTSLPLLTFLFAIWCFSFHLQLYPSSSVLPDLTQPPPPIVRLDPLKMELGWLWGSRYQWSVLASPLCRDCFNSGWIFN